MTVPTLHAQPLYPYMGKGIIDYLGPALLVTGESWCSLSGRGRARYGGHDYFHRAPDTPLCPLSDVTISSESCMMYIVRIRNNERTPC